MQKTTQMIKRGDILRYPRLDTVLMVERAILKAKDALTKTQLWKKLPKGVMYQTFNTILDYLEYSNKIAIVKGRIVWIWDPEGIRKFLEKKHLVVR